MVAEGKECYKYDKVFHKWCDNYKDKIALYSENKKNKNGKSKPIKPSKKIYNSKPYIDIEYDNFYSYNRIYTKKQLNKAIKYIKNKIDKELKIKKGGKNGK